MYCKFRLGDRVGGNEEEIVELTNEYELRTRTVLRRIPENENDGSMEGYNHREDQRINERKFKVFEYGLLQVRVRRWKRGSGEVEQESEEESLQERAGSETSDDNRVPEMEYQR